MSIITFVICAWYIPQRTSIYLSSDEFSQYGQAAYFAGYDWSEIISNLGAHTQFGYPLVFLLPLFLIFGENTLVIYHTSLYINALLAASLVPLSYYILKRWGIKKLITDWIYIPVILMISLAGCVVAYSNLGLSEVLLIVLGFSLTALLLRINEKGTSHFLSALYALLLIYGYSSHMRFIGVTIAGALVFILMVIIKKIKIRYLFSFLSMFAVSFFVSSFLTDFTTSALWTAINIETVSNNEVNLTSINTVANQGIFGRVEKVISNIFTSRNLVALFRASCGQLWYIGLSSFLLVYFGIYAFAKDVVIKLIDLIKNKKPSNIDYPLLFVILGFIATFFISTFGLYSAGIVSPDAPRGDYLIYGRYNSIMFLPIALYAIYTIIERKDKFSISLIVIPITFIALSFYVREMHSLIHRGRYVMLFNVINYSLLYSIARNSIAAFTGFLLIAGSGYFLKKRIFMCIILLPIILFNIMSGYHFIKRDVMPIDNDFIGLNDLAEFRNEDNVYVYRLSTPVVNASKLQMSLPSTYINFIDNIDEIVNNNVTLLFEPKSYFSRDLIEKLTISNMQFTDRMVIALEYDISNTVSPMNLPIDMFNSQNGEIQGTFITSNGSLGYMIYGPYATMEPGEYIFTAELKLIENRNAFVIIGETDGVSGGDIIKHSEHILENMIFIDGGYSLEFIVEIDDTYKNVEFRILTFGGVVLQVSNITITVVK